MPRIDAVRHRLAVGVTGGPTTVVDVGGRRFVSDPTFDPPGDYGPLRKTAPAALDPAELGDVDAVLVSHDEHADNLDRSGRVFAQHAPRLFAPPGAARRLSSTATGLAAWQTWRDHDVTLTAVPARHGPADGEVDADGFVNCEVVGFVLEVRDAPRVYVTGDTTSLSQVRQVRERFGSIDVAILHGGRAAVPHKFGGRPLSLTAEGVVAAVQVLEPQHAVVAHQTHWAHFGHGPADTAAAFEAAGLSHLLRASPLGTWSVLLD